MPLPLKPVPEVVIDEIVRFALPVLLSEIDCVALLPTVTLVKLMPVGLAVNCATGAAVPLPVTGRFTGELEAVLTKETLPAALPIADGTKFNVKESLAPAANANGRVKPVML